MFICPVCNRLHPLSPKQPGNPFPHSSSLLATMSVLYMHAILKIICINSNSSNEYCLICFPPKDLFIYESNFWRNWEIETDTCTLLTVCTTWSTDGSMLHPQGPALNTLQRPRWEGSPQRRSARTRAHSVASVVSGSSRPHGLGPPGSSVHVILQGGTLEWASVCSSRGSSRPRDQTCVSCLVGGSFTTRATWEARMYVNIWMMLCCTTESSTTLQSN